MLLFDKNWVGKMPLIFWTIQPKFSKSDDFAPAYAIINHDLFWILKTDKNLHILHVKHLQCKLFQLKRSECKILKLDIKYTIFVNFVLLTDPMRWSFPHRKFNEPNLSLLPFFYVVRKIEIQTKIIDSLSPNFNFLKQSSNTTRKIFRHLQ